MDVTLKGSAELDHALACARFWLAMAWTALATVFFFTLTLFGLLVPGQAGRRWQLWCARTWAASILWAARCPVVVERLLEAPPQGGFLYFSNHHSMLDILALFVALKDTPFVFAAKRELFKVPFIGWHLRLAGYVEVDRDHRERAISSLARAARQIRERGTVVTLYPEGTRSVDGTILPFKKGPFMLALEAQVPIVPVAVDGAQHALRKHTYRLYGHPIRVVVGRPIETRGLTAADRDDLLRRTRATMLELHRLAGAGPSPVEPMIAPPGKHRGTRGLAD
ncbi:MAG TPA: lysophospholipid acyltransferase family protein [Myxococcales bacterium]|nr:lysophospholipid acyltransferase family protein [Myxococcales bacterium]